jgi:putative polyketide hydroxylase
MPAPTRPSADRRPDRVQPDRVQPERVQPEHVSVLVVGAGPAGLAVAATLARYDVDCLVVDRRERVWSMPRATVASTRTMELLRAWGLADAIRAGGHDVDMQMLECTTLAQAASGTVSPVGFPTREQCAVVSPTATACVPQDHVETVLLDHVATLPQVRVERGVEVTAVDVAPAGARAVLRDGYGRTRVVTASYLVAADGAHSTVRAGLGIAMRGVDGLHHGLSVVLRAPLWHLVGDRRFGMYAITHPDAPGGLFPAGLPDRWMHAFAWPVDQPRPDDGELVRLLRVATGDPTVTPRIDRVGSYTFAAQLADTWHRDRAFLVGDAAHRVTPRGGTGMNSAVRGGYDLAWKLAWVLRGWAGSALLDTYEPEIRPAVEHNLARSIDPSGSVREAITELVADLGGRIPHVWVTPTGGPRQSTLDLLGAGLTLFTGPHDTAWSAAAGAVGAAVPIDVHRLDAVTARALTVRDGGALLVRPDGAPVASWADGAEAGAQLARAVASAVAPRPGRTAAVDRARDVA